MVQVAGGHVGQGMLAVHTLKWAEIDRNTSCVVPMASLWVCERTCKILARDMVWRRNFLTINRGGVVVQNRKIEDTALAKSKTVLQFFLARNSEGVDIAHWGSTKL